MKNLLHFSLIAVLLCASYGLATSESAFADNEKGRARCTDGIDNDEDGLTDSEDPDCAKGIDVAVLEARIAALEEAIDHYDALLAGVMRETGTQNLTFPGYIRTVQDRLDEVARGLAEGVVFINPPGLSGNTGSINGQPVHHISVINNPGYNDGNRFTVELQNYNVSELANGSSIDEINETNIKVYAYDSLFSSTDLEVMSSTSGVELSDYVDYARIVVSHTDGNDISIEAMEIRHRLTLDVLATFAAGDITDLRSSDSQLYGAHKDVPIP